MSQNRTIRRIKLKNNRPGRILVLGVTVRGFVVLLVLLACNVVHAADDKLPDLSKLTPDLQFSVSCKFYFQKIILEESSKDRTEYRSLDEVSLEANVKAKRKCDHAIETISLNVWKKCLTKPQFYGCITATVFATQNMSKDDGGNFAVKWCQGIK